MERKVKVMNYLEVVGSIAHMHDAEYEDFFKKYKEAVEDERESVVADAISNGDITDVEVVPENVADFLDLPDNQIWFISTWKREYVEHV